MPRTPAKQVLKALNELIQSCKDGENGFRTAAERVSIRDVKKLFNTYSAQRARFAADLQAEVERLGGKPTEHGSLTATLQRGWLSIKSLVAGQNGLALIAACRKEEQAAVYAFEAALQLLLPAEVRSVVQRQFDRIQEAQGRLRALEDASSKT
jgi:uncharacterized protein (TIGR02284 family)